MTGPSFMLSWRGEEAKRAAREGARRGVGDAAEFVLGRSAQVVPIEEGTLARSGTADLHPSEPLAAVSYSTPYARIQHERLDFRHDAGRTAKYLERPARSTRREQGALIAAAIRRALR